MKLILTSCLLVLVACSSKAPEPKAVIDPMQKLSATSGLSLDQLKNGVGPITSVILSEIDPKLVKTGEAAFNAKCVACHKLDGRYVGPALRYVVDRREPVYVMNMILNPTEMLAKHPLDKEMLKKYLTQMTFQNVTQEETRALLEYFRQAAADGKNAAIADTETYPSLESLVK